MMTDQPSPAVTTEEVTYCAVHPDRETGLRCNKCGRLMCAECAVLTPVGYRCRECIHQHENKFFTASQSDYILVFVVSLVLAAISGGIVAALPLFLILIFIIAIPAGSAISEVALRLTQRRRGRYSAEVAAVGVVIGGLIGGVAQPVIEYLSAASQYSRAFPNQPIPPLSIDSIVMSLTSDWSLLVFIGVVAFTVYSRFRMRI